MEDVTPDLGEEVPVNNIVSKNRSKIQISLLYTMGNRMKN